MASSRKPRTKPDPADRTLLAALERAVGASLGARLRPRPGTPLLIAYSGGPDSTALLHLAAQLRTRRRAGFARLCAVHVHHGLLPEADAWARHCEEMCKVLAIEFVLEKVHVEATRGLEAGAREARYGALERVAGERGAQIVLAAHHADDRIETFLLQWLRGAGPSGLAGMPSERALGEGGARLVRPFLEVPGAELTGYVARHGLAFVEDPSNQDTRLARNALRRDVLPALARIRAGYRRSAARSIELIAEAAEILDEQAETDLARCIDGAPRGMLRLDRLGALPAARQTLLLRAWLASHGCEAPSRARLAQALEQALGAGSDARMLIRIGTRELRRYRGLLVLRTPSRPTAHREVLHWKGEAQLPVPGWGGMLCFEPAGDLEGIDPQWLAEEPLELRARTGSERFKPNAMRPSRRLKQLFQEAGIPEFERAALPLLWRGEKLLFVPRLGSDARYLSTGPDRIRIHWMPGEGLLEA